MREGLSPEADAIFLRCEGARTSDVPLLHPVAGGPREGSVRLTDCPHKTFEEYEAEFDETVRRYGDGTRLVKTNRIAIRICLDCHQPEICEPWDGGKYIPMKQTIKGHPGEG